MRSKSYLFLLVVLAVYFVYSGGDDTAATTKKLPVPKSKSNTGDTDFIPTDYTDHYPDLKVAAKDAFLPLVTKGGSGNVDPGGLPTYITGGDGNWEYTGMVQVNGNDQALLENTKSMDNVYLAVGQHWKRGKVKRISDSDVQLEGDNGKLFTVKMSEGQSKKDNVTVAENSNPNEPAAVQPPALAGQIGAAPGLDVTPLPAVQMVGGGNGGGFGRRRGGRGFRGGGGNGGGG